MSLKTSSEDPNNMSLLGASQGSQEKTNYETDASLLTSTLSSNNHRNNQSHTSINTNIRITQPLLDNENPSFSPINSKKSSRSSHSSDFERVNASVLSSVLNLSNTILGAGILALPFAMAKCGIILGFILFCVFALFSATGLQLLCHSANEVPNSDFTKLSRHTIPKLKVLVDLAVAVKCFGVGTSYMMVSGDLMPKVMEFFVSDNVNHIKVLEQRHIWISLFTILFIVPIVHWKNLDNLRYISSFCLIFFAFVVLTIYCYAFINTDNFNACHGIDDNNGCPATRENWPTNALDMFGVLPLFIFGFTCHQNAFAITNELRNPTHSRLNIVVYGAIFVCLIVYGSASYAGYYAYGNLHKFPQDILSEYPNSWMTTGVRLVLSINLSLSYPLQLNPCRNSLSQLFFKKRALELDYKRYYGLSYAITLCSWIIGMSVSSLGAVLAIVGATGSTTISYILPGLFYYYTFKESNNNKKYIALMLFSLGCMIVPFALTMIFVSGEASG